MPRALLSSLLLILLSAATPLGQDGGSTIIPKREVNEVLLQGLDNLAAGRTVSDIVVRHLDVGDEHLGVSVVQRSKVEITQFSKIGIVKHAAINIFNMTRQITHYTVRID